MSRWSKMKFLPSTHVAPTSSKSLLASNFKSEPTEIHLCQVNRNREKKYTRGVRKREFKPDGVHSLEFWMGKKWNLIHFKKEKLKKEKKKKRLQLKTYNAFLLPWYQFSQINPAIVRPLPTPAPSPIKNPALAALGSRWRCLCHGNKLNHSIKPDTNLLTLCSALAATWQA